jgi:poly(A) polymerase
MTQRSDDSPAQTASRDDAVAVVRRLRDAGHIAYFAGGCVRDMLLGLEPKDYDVATDAPPDRVRQLFASTQAVGAAFGVILVRQRKSIIEVATFRTDLQYTDGRRPEGVVFTTAEEDAKRRDFTINGLFFDPIENKVIDYVGGQEDLKKKILRAIGEPNHRFEEDHLRLLRAVRFAARFGLKIDPATCEAMARHAQQLVRISPERIAEELRIMLTATTRASALELIAEFGFEDVIFRFLQRPTPPTLQELTSRRSMLIFNRVAPGRTIPFGLALAAASVEHFAQRLPSLNDWPALIRELSVRSVSKSMRQALRISNEEADELEGSLYGVEMLLADPSPGVVTIKRFLARPTASLSRMLLLALPLDHAGELEQRLAEVEKTEFAPPPLITGDDLTAAGLQPGPVFKRVLDAIYDAQLDDRITSKEQALTLALQLAKGD